MQLISDKRRKILSKGTVVAYVENGLLEYGRVIDGKRPTLCKESEVVRIERLHDGIPTGLIDIRPAKAVMKVVLPDA